MAKPTTEEWQARREAKLDALGERFEQAVQELVTGQDWLRAIEFAARFRSRSFANTLLILVQHLEAYENGRVPEPEPSYVAGFKQWQQLGRTVTKGQAGYAIWAPVTARLASRAPSRSDSWRRLGYREKPKAGETVRTKMIGVKPAYVWDVSQTDGEPVPARPRPVLLEGQAPSGLWDGIADQIRDKGFAILDAPSAAELEGANGCTDFTQRKVFVRSDMDDAARVNTLLHELAHIALGHEDRGAGGLHRGIGEVEAESVAAMVTAAYGMDSAGYSVAYVARWSTNVEGREPINVLRATGETVRKTALAILDNLPEPPGGDGNPPGLDRGRVEPEETRQRPQVTVPPVNQPPRSATEDAMSL